MYEQEEPRNDIAEDDDETSNFVVLLKNLLYLDLFPIVGLIITFGPKPFQYLQSMELLFPLLISIATCTVIALLWQWFIFFNPSIAIAIAFFWHRNLTFLVWVFQGLFEPGVLANNIITIRYHEIQYFKRLLTASIANPNPIPLSNINFILIPLMVLGSLYYTFLVSIIFQAINVLTNVWISHGFVLMVLPRMVLTTQVIGNIILVTITRIKYMNHTRRTEAMDTLPELRRTLGRNSTDNVFWASVTVPLLELIHALSRALHLLAKVIDFGLERAPVYINSFMEWAWTTKMTSCYWGLVHVAAYSRDITQASEETNNIFHHSYGLPELIVSDLTGFFCFVCGVGGGAICSLVGFAIQESYPTQLLLCNFLIGYSMTQIAMAWPHACVLAYYVAYAEEPYHFENDTTIPDRIQELEELHAHED